jgi:hypothetical protein
VSSLLWALSLVAVWRLRQEGCSALLLRRLLLSLWGSNCSNAQRKQQQIMRRLHRLRLFSLRLARVLVVLLLNTLRRGAVVRGKTLWLDLLVPLRHRLPHLLGRA